MDSGLQDIYYVSQSSDCILYSMLLPEVKLFVWDKAFTQKIEDVLFFSETQFIIVRKISDDNYNSPPGAGHQNCFS